MFYSYGRTDLASKNSGRTRTHSLSLLILFSGVLLGEVKANGLLKMGRTNMKEQENFSRKLVLLKALASLFEITL